MKKFNPADFESKWRSKWEEEQIYKTPEIKDGDNKQYILDMYPYPSGSGLHVGHPRGYVATDVYARYQRLLGKKVMHPIGFDSFGLPAENYAIKTGVHPDKSTNDAIKYFREQISQIGLSYDWDKQISSHDAEFTKWTQWLFIQLYNAGLAYQKEAAVNWCETDQTVLANEQVEADGTCERCGNPVIQKNLKQWFFKITDYADELIDGLENIDWPESTKAGQRNWIGRSEGARIKFKVQNSKSQKEEFLEVFTTRPDTIFGATFMVVAPEHELIRNYELGIINYEEISNYFEKAKGKTELERQQQKEKTGIKIEGVSVINPATNKEIPIYVADYVLGGYGTGAIMAVPAHDERDFEFAEKYGIEIKSVVIPESRKDTLPVKITNERGETEWKLTVIVSESQDSEIRWSEYIEDVKSSKRPFIGEGLMINSEQFNGLRSEEAKLKIIQWVTEKGIGSKQVNYKLRDWLVSRQRYWGCPIPVVYDAEGNANLVPVEDLPVLLPTDVDFKPTGESPLKSSKTFHESAEKKYGKGYRREVDTMDTFVDSSWYFFRFADAHNTKEFASKEMMNMWMPVDLYVGGAEHTVLHLMYARFITKFLRDQGYFEFGEPFQKLRHPGMILAEDHRKMSKRWGNTVDPNDEIEKFGADTLRMYEMFIGPFNGTIAWSTKTEIGVFRFLSKVWDLQDKITEEKNDKQEVELQKTIKKVQEDIVAMSFNTAVAKMMEFTNFLTSEEKIDKSVLERFTIVIAPFAPYIAEELWNILGHEFSVHNQTWPEVDESKLVEDVIEMAVQINGKVRGTISIAPDADESTAMQKAREVENIAKYIEGEPRKVIYIPGKILNIVV